MLTCMSDGQTIPPGVSPIFTEGMRDLIVCCTGFDAVTRNRLQERIEYMGGIFHSTLRSVITHVVAHNNISPKAIEGFKAGKPVMTEDWVEAVWQRSLEANVRGGDSEFQKFRSPLFHNLKITTSGITKRKKEQLKDLIVKNGGKFTGTLELHSTDILIIDSPEGEKYKAAKDWKVACVKSSWIQECVKLGKIVPLAEHGLEGRRAKASTPLKNDVNFTAHFSMVSAIENDERNVSRLEESADVTASQQSVAQAVRSKSANADLIDRIAQDAVEAGQFLDGCNVFLSGFNQPQAEKLKRVLNMGGATRYDELTKSVTHIIVATVGPSSDSFIESGAHVLPLEWLAESVALKRSASVDRYMPCEVSVARIDPPSPLSQQGARLLSRPEPRRLDLDVEVPAPEEPPHDEDDLVHRYNLSQQGEPLAERSVSLPKQPEPVAQPNRDISQRGQVLAERPLPNLTPNPSFASSRSDATQANADLFKTLKFFLSQQLTDEELVEAERLIERSGGTVVSRKFPGVPEYAIVPFVGATLTEVTALEVVNLFFLRDCILENQIVAVQYYHLPIPWVLKSTPLKGCVFSVSKYVGSERDFIETVIETLGAVVQAILAKKKKNEILQTTHLICAEPSGMKYEGAVRWGVPVVHHNWLFKCAELGKRVPEEPFLLTETKVVSATTSGNGTALSTPASVRKPNNVAAASCRPSVLVRTENVFVEKAAPLTERLQTSDGLREKSVERPLTPPSRSITYERTMTPEVARKTPLELSRTRTSPTTNPPRETSQASSPPPAPPLIEAVASPLNKALERLKHAETPKGSLSPDMNRTVTPCSPYGACFGNDNPSPGTRKRLQKWMHQGANLTPDPPPTRQETSRRESTPVSELLSRQLRLVMRRPEEQPPDDSPEPPPAKRPNLSLSESQSVKKDLLTRLQKMREIEESYSRTNVAVPSPVVVSEEPKVVIVTESQPHTEIGWEDPSDRELALEALASLEKAADKIGKEPLKVFILSGLADSFESAKELIEKSGGQVLDTSQFDKSSTHLIAGPSMTRAEKLMGSIAAGLWVLHPSYLTRLAVVKDVSALKEEDFEWGNPKVTMPLNELSPKVRECVVSAHHWRCDIKLRKKPPPFFGMQFILKIAPPKSEVFKRLFEAGGGRVKTVDTVGEGGKVFCLQESVQTLSQSEMEFFAKKGICCVTTLFISDVILRKPTAVVDNMVTGFADVWKKWQV